MTFEEFKELALNPPRRDEDTIFEVIEYDINDLPGKRRNHYPKFDVRHFRVGFCHTLDRAEAMIHNAIEEAKKYSSEIYCFHIKEYSIDELLIPTWGDYGTSWRLYDSYGQFLDKTYCSALERDSHTIYGHYRGRPKESFRFKAGDIVEVLNGDEVRLAVATGAPLSINWYWSLMERIKNREGIIEEYSRDNEMTDLQIEDMYFPDSGDDQIPVIDGPSYNTHDHVAILNIMPLHYKLSNKMRQRFEGYYNAMLKEEEPLNKKDIIPPS